MENAQFSLELTIECIRLPTILKYGYLSIITYKIEICGKSSLFDLVPTYTGVLNGLQLNI
jgi:hypothetical protein